MGTEQESSSHVPAKTHDSRGKFTIGNKLGRAPKTAAEVALLRHRAIQYFSNHPEQIDEFFGILKEIARDKTAPHAARVAAVKELLSRGLGNPDITINLSQEEREAEMVADPVEYGRRAMEAGVKMYRLTPAQAWETLPPEVQAVTPRPIVATVTSKESK